MSRWATNLLGLGLLAIVVACVILLLAMWPLVATTSGDEAPTAEWGLLGLGPWSMSRETALLVMVILVSALGSFVHAATSFATYAGNRRLYRSWLWWYGLRAGIGGALALIVYFAIRGGLFTGNATTDDLNPYGIAAIAGLTGLFSKQATDKLQEVFTTLLATSGGAGDDQRSDKVTFPAPEVGSVTPAEVAASSGDLEVDIAGDGFVAGSKGQALREAAPRDVAVLPTTYISSTSLRVVVPAALLADPGTVFVSVVNPEPGGGESDPATLLVTPPP